MSESNILAAQGNLALTYAELGRHEESLRIEREVYARKAALNGRDNESTLISAGNLASTLLDDLEHFDEARAFLRDRIPEATRALGKDHDITFKLQRMYAQCHYENADASQDDVTAAIAQLEDLDRRTTRTYGAAHPQTCATRDRLAEARETLARAK